MGLCLSLQYRFDKALSLPLTNIILARLTPDGDVFKSSPARSYTEMLHGLLDELGYKDFGIATQLCFVGGPINQFVGERI